MVSLLSRLRGQDTARTTATTQTSEAVTRKMETTNAIDEKSDLKQSSSEKHQPESTESSDPIDRNHDDEDEADLPDDVRELPKIVRNIVSLEDDPNAPTITFRYFVLCLLFVPPGAILYQMGQFRTTSAAYPVLFVQVGKCY
jgi:hypothetical protein